MSAKVSSRGCLRRDQRRHDSELGSEIDACGCDVLLVAILSVEAGNVFDGLKVAGFVVFSSGIIDVVNLNSC